MYFEPDGVKAKSCRARKSKPTPDSRPFQIKMISPINYLIDSSTMVPYFVTFKIENGIYESKAVNDRKELNSRFINYH